MVYHRQMRRPLDKQTSFHDARVQKIWDWYENIKPTKMKESDLIWDENKKKFSGTVWIDMMIPSTYYTPTYLYLPSYAIKEVTNTKKKWKKIVNHQIITLRPVVIVLHDSYD